MAITPQEPHGQDGQHPFRPVLGALEVAVKAMADSQPTRTWALSEPELAKAVQALGELSAMVDATLVSVLAEAASRGLGTGEGWGPVDWARSLAPLLPLRTITDAQAVARVAGDPRLSGVLEAATVGATPTEGSTTRSRRCCRSARRPSWCASTGPWRGWRTRSSSTRRSARFSTAPPVQPA